MLLSYYEKKAEVEQKFITHEPLLLLDFAGIVAAQLIGVVKVADIEYFSKVMMMKQPIFQYVGPAFLLNLLVMR